MLNQSNSCLQSLYYIIINIRNMRLTFSFQIFCCSFKITINKLIYIFNCTTRLSFRTRNCRFGIQRYTRSILMSLISLLKPLYKIKMTKSTHCKCLTHQLSDSFRITCHSFFSRNNIIYIINHSIIEVPYRV